MPPRKLTDLPGAAERQARLLAEINADADAAMARAAADAAAKPGAAPTATRPVAASPSAPSRALVPAPAPAVGHPDALSAELASLGETLDMMATLTASVSDRVDGQTVALAKLASTVAEARAAAFAARAQADPGKLAAEVEHALDATLRPHLRELIGAVAEVGRTNQAVGEARRTLERAEGQLLDARRDLAAAHAEARRWKGRVGAALLGGLLLAVVLALAMPRVVTPGALSCRLAGGAWLGNAERQQACVFWASE